MQETLASAPTMANRRKRVFTQETLTSLAFFLFLWYFWGVRYGDYLFAAQENSIFLYDYEYFSRWLQVPEGLLCYATSFLMQFFYFPILGGAILAALTIAGQILMARLAELKGVARLTSFLPGAFVAVSSTWPAYYVYIPYEQPLIFPESLAILVALGGFALYRAFENKRWRSLLGVALVVVLYPLVGFWGFFATALCCAWELARLLSGWKERDVRNVALGGVVLLALGAILAPLFWHWESFYLSIKSNDVFLRGLLEDVRYDKSSLVARVAYGGAALAPLTILIVLFVARTIACRPKKAPSARRVARQEERYRARIVAKENKRKARENDSKRKGKSETRSDPLAGLSEEEKRVRFERERESSRVRLVWELLVVLAAFVFLAAYHTKSFFIVLKQTRALAVEDWEEILRVEANDPFPINPEIQMRNLALFYTGQLTERAFERPVGGLATLPVTGYDYGRALHGNLLCKFKVKLFTLRRDTEQCAERVLCELLYCYWGQTNIAARIATNNLIASEDRSASFLRTLAIAAMVNGEDKLARRYLRTLSQTLFYRDWAAVRLAYLETPGFYEGVRDYHDDEAFGELLKKRQEERPRAASDEDAAKRYGVDVDEIRNVAATVLRMRELRPVVDYTTTRGYPNLVFLYQLAKEEEFDESPRDRQDIILISALMQKKKDFFLEHIEPILKKEYPNGGAPKAYEQGYATWRFQAFGRDKWKDCDYKFSPETIELFEQFADYIVAVQGVSGTSSDEVQEVLRNSCRGMYWGYASDESVFNHY